MLTQKIVTFHAEQAWKMVYISSYFCDHADHFVNDDMLEDGSSGLYGILDGHGGGEVVKFCNKSVPEVFSMFIFLLINYTQTFDKLYDDNENNIEKLYQLVFNRVDDQLKMVGALDSGSTICTCFVRKENSLYQIFNL